MTVGLSWTQSSANIEDQKKKPLKMQDTEKCTGPRGEFGLPTEGDDSPGVTISNSRASTNIDYVKKIDSRLLNT